MNLRAPVPVSSFVMDDGLPVAFAFVDAAWLLDHEEIVPPEVASLAIRIEKEGLVLQPVVADGATGTILDGHHRVAALRRLGCRRIPAYLVPYEHGSIAVASWRAEPPPSKADVVSRARERRPFPPKTTRHERLRRLPQRPTPISELRAEAA